MSEEMVALEAEIQQEASDLAAAGGLLEEDVVPVESKPEEAPPVEVKMVPHEALHEERERRKQAETRLREQSERLESRLQTLAQKFEEVTTPAAVKPPDFDEDPAGYLKYQVDQLARNQEQAQEATRETEETAQRQNQFKEFLGAYQADATKFSQEKTDFADAYQHLLQDRDQELQELGFYDEGIRLKIIQNEEIGIVEQALREGVSPALRLYNLSKRRGWKGAQPAPHQAQDDIQRLKRGQSAARSLSEVGGQGAVNAPSLETIANMDEEEFQKAVSGKNWEKLFKGK